MIGRMEIREVLGMLGTLAALSVVGSAVQLVDAEIGGAGHTFGRAAGVG